MVEHNPTRNAGYGFSGRMRPEFPSQVIIDVTEYCNLACLHCPQEAFRNSDYFSGAMLDPALNAKAVDEVAAAGKGIAQYIRYTAEGEPLLHPQLWEMMRYAAQHAHTSVTLTTNGALLDATAASRLLDTGVHVVDFSIDAFSDETYSRIRRKGDLRVTRANVLGLIKAAKDRRAQIKIVTSFIEQPLNQHEAADFKRFWEEQGADYVVLRRLHSAAGTMADTAAAMHDANQTLERWPCPYPWERIVLSPRGELFFCPAGWSHSATVADYRTTTLAAAWQGPFYLDLRQSHLDNDYTRAPFCGQCPDWSATRWPDAGRSYASMIEDFSEKP